MNINLKYSMEDAIDFKCKEYLGTQINLPNLRSIAKKRNLKK